MTNLEKIATNLQEALEFARREHADFLNQLIDACNFDAEIAIGSPEAAILAVVRRKVAEYDQRIEADQQQVNHWRETAEAENTARGKAETERDLLIEACVAPAWRSPTAYTEGGNGYEWRFGITGGFFYDKADAIRAVGKAAGLEDTPR